MRRQLNIRKKNKIVLNNLNKKIFTILICLILTLIICIVMYFYFIQNIFIKQNLENESIYFSILNEDIPFSIKKILLFSSATAESQNINQSLSLNISQYSDIAIYLSNTSSPNKAISSIYIDNIKISAPNLGTPYLYKKNILNFGKCSFSKDNIISNKFDFDVITEKHDLNHDNSTIYNNSTFPLCLGFFNQNIKTDFSPNNPEILYNGSLLKEATIPVSSLNCTISFIINIITDSNAHYICNVNFDIPLKDKENSIYNVGYITKELNSNELNNFIRIK